MTALLTQGLLEVDQPEAEVLPAPLEHEGVSVEFRAVGAEGQIWALASSAHTAFRRGIYSVADGLLVGVGNREDEASLHLPLFGPAISITGSQAPRLAEAMVLAAQARGWPGDLAITVVGDVGDFFATGRLGGHPGDPDEPEPILWVGAGEEEELRARLCRQVSANADLAASYGLADLGPQALAGPDDRPQVALVVLAAPVAPEWAALLDEGEHNGLAGIVVGDWPDAQRRLHLDDEGLLHVTAPGLEPIVITPCNLPAGALGELAAVIQEGADADPEEPAAMPPPAAAPAAPMEPRGARPSIRTFGNLAVTNEAGEAVAQPTKRRRATNEALAYLATHPGWVRKETLRAVLFPYRDPRDNPEDLHVAITEARRWLIEAFSGDPRPDGSPRNLGLALIAQSKSQGYRLADEYVDVDLAVFNELVAAAQDGPESEDGLRAVLAAHPDRLLAGEDFAWVRREGLADAPEKKVAWAAITLSRLLQDRHRPQEALDVLEPLLNHIVNDELWIQAMLCEGEPPPRGLGAGDRVANLHGRYVRHLRACQLDTSDNLEAVYCALLAHDPLAQETR